MNLVEEVQAVRVPGGVTEQEWGYVRQLKRAGFKAYAKKVRGELLQRVYLSFPMERIEAWNDAHFVSILCSDRKCRHEALRHIESRWAFWGGDAPGCRDCSCALARMEVLSVLPETTTWPRLSVVPVEDYTLGTPPPATAFETLTSARQYFSNFSVLTRQEITMQAYQTLRDPLLLGHWAGGDRYYVITQWGQDVVVDDLV